MNETAVSRKRLPVVDALRGFAIVLMVLYHFCFDLSYFGLADFDFYNDRFWLTSRTVILSLFLGLVGISLVLATHKGLNRTSYLRRLVTLVASAAIVSLATWWLFGDRYVFFGVLHFITLASVLGLFFVHGVWSNLVLGCVLILFSAYFQFSFFNAAEWQWVGLMTYKPPTEDYVPVLPWFGVVLIGIFTGQRLLCFGPQRLAGIGAKRGRWLHYLAFPGRHSLLIYLLHQPLLMGMLYLYTKVVS